MEERRVGKSFLMKGGAPIIGGGDTFLNGARNENSLPTMISIQNVALSLFKFINKYIRRMSIDLVLVHLLLTLNTLSSEVSALAC